MSSIQNFYELRRQCLSTGKLFTDPNFPASEVSLMLKSQSGPIKWCRPQEICANPRFVVEGFSRFDVRQGDLGDCWFLAALATLTQNQKLLGRVVYADNDLDVNYAGIFHFRFWKYGKWIEIVIDDFLPTINGKLLFMKAPESEFWGPLLEKAYSKFYGSYGAIEGGYPAEAMIDFTGGVLERYGLNNPPSDLFNIILKASERDSLITTCIMMDSPSCGLIGHHAYSITKAQLIDIGTNAEGNLIKMLRIRNPWANHIEWNGAYGDKSPEWKLVPKNELKKLNLKIQDDGEFWMKFEDFLNYFYGVELCHVSPNALDLQGSRKKWNESVHEGKWGFSQNIIVELKDVDEHDNDDLCTFIVCLTQKNRREMGFPTKEIKFDIFKVRLINGKWSNTVNGPIESHKPEAYREICARFKLLPGHYAIVPSVDCSMNCGEYMLRIFTETYTGRYSVVRKVEIDPAHVNIEALVNQFNDVEINLPLPRATISSKKLIRFALCVFIFIVLLALLLYFVIYYTYIHWSSKTKNHL